MAAIQDVRIAIYIRLWYNTLTIFDLEGESCLSGTFLPRTIRGEPRI